MIKHAAHMQLQISPAWPASQIDDTIEAALGSPFTTLETNFGVLKTLLSATSMVLQLGSAPNVTFNVTAADVVYPMYPWAGLAAAQNCTWANPPLLGGTTPPAGAAGSLPNLAAGMT